MPLTDMWPVAETRAMHRTRFVQTVRLYANSWLQQGTYRSGPYNRVTSTCCWHNTLTGHQAHITSNVPRCRCSLSGPVRTGLWGVTKTRLQRTEKHQADPEKASSSHLRGSLNFSQPPRLVTLATVWWSPWGSTLFSVLARLWNYFGPMHTFKMAIWRSTDARLDNTIRYPSAPNLMRNCDGGECSTNSPSTRWLNQRGVSVRP